MSFYSIIELCQKKEYIDLNFLVLIYHDVRVQAFYQCPCEIKPALRNNVLSEILEEHLEGRKYIHFLEEWYSHYIGQMWWNEEKEENCYEGYGDSD